MASKYDPASGPPKQTEECLVRAISFDAEKDNIGLNQSTANPVGLSLRENYRAGRRHIPFSKTRSTASRTTSSLGSCFRGG